MNYLSFTHENSVYLSARNRVQPAKITYCEGDRNYTHVHFVHRPKLTLSVTMRIIHERLGESEFLRISRSVLVNTGSIVHYTYYHVTLRNGLILPVARRRREHVRRALYPLLPVI